MDAVRPEDVLTKFEVLAAESVIHARESRVRAHTMSAVAIKTAEAAVDASLERMRRSSRLVRQRHDPAKPASS